VRQKKLDSYFVILESKQAEFTTFPIAFFSQTVLEELIDD